MTNKLNKLLDILGTPKTALIGAVVFCSIWLLLGLYNDFIADDFIKCISDNVNCNVPQEKTYLPWYKDILGHYLAIITFLAAYCFWLYEPNVEHLLGGRERFQNLRLRTLKKWLFIIAPVCIIMVINNVYYITYESKNIAHWSDLRFPILFPAIIASAYYLGVLMPLFLSLISFGFNINASVLLPKSLIGFNTHDPKNCFGISHLGNAIYLVSTFLLFILIPSIIIQIIQKNQISYGSLFITPLGLYILYKASLSPGAQLTLQLSKIKSDEAEVYRLRIKKLLNDEENNIEKIKALNERLNSILNQSVIPVYKPLALFTYLLAAPLLAISVINWIITLAKKLPT